MYFQQNRELNKLLAIHMYSNMGFKLHSIGRKELLIEIDIYR